MLVSGQKATSSCDTVKVISPRWGCRIRRARSRGSATSWRAQISANSGEVADKLDWAFLKEHFQAVTAYNMYYRPKFLQAVQRQFKAADRAARARGMRLIPNVMPGYYKREDLTRAAFDEEGFYRIGDAVKFADADDPVKGIVFDGRVAEDFKLSSGTWVHVGAIRVKLIAAADPLIQDAVITGHDRAEIGALVFLSAAAKGVADVRERLQAALRKLAQEGGSSTHPRRLMVMSEPPSIDANEITDKGYMNQRAVLERRAALVEQLYAGSNEMITA